MFELTRGCPVCGSPDRSCSGGHATTGPGFRLTEEATAMKPAEVIARATINGVQTEIRTTREEAAAKGWAVLAELPGARARHKARTVETAGTKTEPSPRAQADELGEASLTELRRRAKAAGIKGRSTMDRGELEAALRDREA